jgi:hypothetical protein
MGKCLYQFYLYHLEITEMKEVEVIMFSFIVSGEDFRGGLHSPLSFMLLPSLVFRLV